MTRCYRIGDAAIQVLLLFATIYAVVSQTDNLLPVMIFIGSWYVISVGVHVLISSKGFKIIYKAYAYITVVIVTLLVTGYYFPPFLLLISSCLLFAVPILAACYTYNCFAEILYVRKRPISYLK